MKLGRNGGTRAGSSREETVIPVAEDTEAAEEPDLEAAPEETDGDL